MLMNMTLSQLIVQWMWNASSQTEDRKYRSKYSQIWCHGERKSIIAM